MNKPDQFDGIAKNTEEVFSSIAHRYDLLNHILSFGLDFYWRRAAVRITQPRINDQILDCCCGTGDFTLAFAKVQGAEGRVIGCDASQKMLDLASKKTDAARKRLKFACSCTYFYADCTRLSESCEHDFDLVSCAFGLRNIADFRSALSQMRQVLKPGGRICILEFTLPKQPLVRTICLLYFQYLLPPIGGLISGRPLAYRHLRDSIRRWDETVELCRELENAGFTNVVQHRLTLGIASVYIAAKPEN